MARQLVLTAVLNWRFPSRFLPPYCPLCSSQWCRRSTFSQSGVIIVITKLSSQFFRLFIRLLASLSFSPLLSTSLAVDCVHCCGRSLCGPLVIRQLQLAVARSASIIKAGVRLTYSRCGCLAFFLRFWFPILSSQSRFDQIYCTCSHTYTHTHTRIR